MKNSLIAAALLAGIATGAQAADGIISFQGSIANQTCGIVGGGQDVTVTLPRVSQQSLQTVGATAGRTPFKIALTNCSIETGWVRTFFENGPTTDAGTGNLNLYQTNGSAKNVQIQLLNKSLTQILLGRPLSEQNADRVHVAADGTATMYYYGQYMSPTGGATAGEANTSVQYTIAYQ